MGLIAILACLTTAVGLFGASTNFFHTQFPQISHTRLLIIQVIVAGVVANLGLATLMNVVVPLMYFCYPATIAIIAVALVDIAVPCHLHWSYRLSAWVAALFGLVDAFAQGFVLFGATPPTWFTVLIEAIPLADLSLGWLVPALGAFSIGVIWDGATGRLSRRSGHHANAISRSGSGPGGRRGRHHRPDIPGDAHL